MTLNDICLQLRREYGSDANAARAYDITPQQWSKLKNRNLRPMQTTLEKLGLIETRSYQWKK